MSSVSFDYMAQVYDAIRGYPHEVAQKITQTIDQAVQGTIQTRFLEVGIGTGRIAFPLSELGRQYTGVDISAKMLGQLEEKLRASGWREAPHVWGSMPDEETTQTPDVQFFVQEEKQRSMRLVRADMTSLPFYDASFDVGIAVHVFHLIGEWQKALEEIMRVLRPGGMLIRCWNENWQECWEPGSGDIRKEWSRIVKELGGSTEFVGTTEQSVTAWLETQGFKTEQWEIIRWQRPVTPRILFESVAQYQGARTWTLPDDLFDTSITRLRQWVDERCGTHIDEELLQEERLMIGRTFMR